MSGGNDFCERIDVVVNEMGLSRNKLGILLGISSSTMATWKTKDNLPSSETVAAIAKKLQVSSDWLVNGWLCSPKEDQMQVQFRQTVWSSIYQLLPEQSESLPFSMTLDGPDSQSVLITTQQQCKHMKYLNKLVDYWALHNWSKCRCELPYWTFESIAFSLNTSVQSLFSNETISNEPSINKELYSLAQENKEELLCYSKLTPANKAKVKTLLEDTYKLQTLEGIG